MIGVQVVHNLVHSRGRTIVFLKSLVRINNGMSPGPRKTRSLPRPRVPINRDLNPGLHKACVLRRVHDQISRRAKARHREETCLLPRKIVRLNGSLVISPGLPRLRRRLVRNRKAPRRPRLLHDRTPIPIGATNSAP